MFNANLSLKAVHGSAGSFSVWMNYMVSQYDFEPNDRGLGVRFRVHPLLRQALSTLGQTDSEGLMAENDS